MSAKRTRRVSRQRIARNGPVDVQTLLVQMGMVPGTAPAPQPRRRRRRRGECPDDTGENC